MKYVSITVICISYLLPMGRNWKKNLRFMYVCGYLFLTRGLCLLYSLHSMNEDLELEDILLLVTGYSSITYIKFSFYKQYISLDPKTHKLSPLHFLKV